MNKFKFSIKWKIALPVTVILALLVFTLNILMFSDFTRHNAGIANEKLSEKISSLDYYLDSCLINSKAAVVSMSHNTYAVEYIEERNTQGLLQLFTGTHDTYQINYYTICDSDGVVLARTHAPDRHGDSAADQSNIQGALGGHVLSGFAGGSAVKASVHSEAPVYNDDGKLIGAISAGVRLDTQDAVMHLKSLLRVDVSVFIGDSQLITTIIPPDGQAAADTSLDPEIADIVINQKREHSVDTNIYDEPYKAFYRPLINAQDEVFATVFLGIPLSETMAASAAMVEKGVIVGLLGFLISIALLLLVLNSIVKPVSKIRYNIDHFAHGDLSIQVDTKGNDELSQLGQSLQTAISTIQKLHEEIYAVIKEQERGNTDYRLDHTIFHGDFRILAENISKLANFSIQDLLTGLPNRRSFNNRLRSEWDLAKRERFPISILMMDLDWFKNYNDTYGHQQGDVALQTISSVFADKVRRSGDFIARWGGEEFVALLYNTDSAGALTVAESLRAEIESASIPCANDKTSKITISIGASTQIPDNDSSENDLIAKADAALYTAKKEGRNRVCLYTEDK